MKIHTIHASELAQKAAERLNEEFRRLASEEKPFLFLASGGSSLALLDLLDTTPFGPLATVGVLDDRFSRDPLVNNFALLEKTQFAEKARDLGACFVNTFPEEGETIEEVASRFESAIREWRDSFPDGAMVATVGVGPDGHTSGIMPFPENPSYFAETFDDKKKWTAGYDAGSKNQYPLRVTVTLPFLRMLDFSLTYAKGDDKKVALDRVCAKEGTLAETPGRILRELKNEELVTDQAIVLR